MEHKDEGDQENIIDNVDKQFTFYVGMKFNSIEKAYETYNSYAILKGFSVRKGKKYWNRANELTRCTFLCSCEGISSTRAPHEEIKRERLQFRCGCNARIKFKVSGSELEVVEFNDEHNHSFVEENQKHFISSARKLNTEGKRLISALVDTGIKPKQAFRFLAKEAGGIENVGFIEQDCHNYLQKCKASTICAGDAQTLINYFKTRMAEEVDFFYTVQLDEDGRLCNIFWRDAISRLHYECFGDVVTFDTTFRTNKYGMSCAPFVGVNNHWKNVFFGCAFLCSDNEVSFRWLFNAFVESMGGKHPTTIFTDQDGAMANAIKGVLPHTYHRLCQWHIERNAAQNIPHLLGKSDFKRMFNKVLWSCESIDEFESVWENMMTWVNKVSNGGNDWLDRLYRKKSHWCHVFSLAKFSARIRSTQRSESTNRVIGAMSGKTTSLREFVKRYEVRSSEMRDIEAKDDINSRGKPTVRVRGCGILNHAAQVYTRTIFYDFQDEFLHALSEKLLSDTDNGLTRVFTLQDVEKRKSYIVQYTEADQSITCSCHLFETLGYLCRHALRVIHLDLNFSSIPENYILKRWTKNTKHGLDFTKYFKKTDSCLSSSMCVSLNELMRKSFSVMTIAAPDESLKKLASEYLDRLSDAIERELNHRSVEKGENEIDVGNPSVLQVQDDEQYVRDPVPRKSRVYTRIKSSIEKKKKRRTKVIQVEPHGSIPLQTFTTGLHLHHGSSLGQGFQATSFTMPGSDGSNSSNIYDYYNQVIPRQNTNMTFTQLLEQGISNSHLNYNQHTYLK